MSAADDAKTRLPDSQVTVGLHRRRMACPLGLYASVRGAQRGSVSRSDRARGLTLLKAYPSRSWICRPRRAQGHLAAAALLPTLSRGGPLGGGGPSRSRPFSQPAVLSDGPCARGAAALHPVSAGGRIPRISWTIDRVTRNGCRKVNRAGRGKCPGPSIPDAAQRRPGSRPSRTQAGRPCGARGHAALYRF
jgi:hypothetical protein